MDKLLRGKKCLDEINRVGVENKVPVEVKFEDRRRRITIYIENEVYGAARVVQKRSDTDYGS